MYNSLLKLNISNSKSLDDVKYYMSKALLPDRFQKDVVEYDVFGIEEKKSSNWKYPDFTYKINQYGFRIENISDSCNIGAFGCSYTFGQGLPLEMTWSKLIEEETKTKVLNFGVPGISLISVLDIFCIVTKHIKMQYAVILLPSYSRFQVAKYNKKNELGILSCIPGSPGFYNSSYGIDEENIFKNLIEDDLVKQTKNSLYHAELIAESRNINLLISSWDRPTHELLQQMHFRYIKLLPPWSSRQDFINDKARDNRHPGPKHHISFSEQILPFLKNS